MTRKNAHSPLLLGVVDLWGHAAKVRSSKVVSVAGGTIQWYVIVELSCIHDIVLSCYSING